MDLQPANPNDRSFLSSVFIGANATAYRKVRSALDLMGLPHPEEGQYFSGDNADRIFLNDEGLILSVVYKRQGILRDVAGLFRGSADIAAPVFEARKLKNDHVLQPLLQIDLSHNCCLEIVPGIEQIGATKDQIKELAEILRQEKIKFRKRPDFAGFIRTPDDQENLLVVSNRRAVEQMRRYTETENGAGMQDLVYGSSREEIIDSFQTASAAKVAKTMGHFAQIVALKKDDPARNFNAPWLEPTVMTERRRDVMRAANSFQKFRYAA